MHHPAKHLCKHRYISTFLLAVTCFVVDTSVPLRVPNKAQKNIGFLQIVQMVLQGQVYRRPPRIHLEIYFQLALKVIKLVISLIRGRLFISDVSISQLSGKPQDSNPLYVLENGIHI